ncbi:MAG: preprotein translocase subunit SecY [Planctomycetota bacterium]
MLNTVLNIFKVPELRNKVLFTLLMLAIYRIGFQIPLTGIDQEAFAASMENQGDAGERLAAYVSIFSGGSLSQSTIFGLGVMPYISASIIFQLLGSAVPALQKLKKEGQAGQRKIQEWTRYATVVIAGLQGMFWLSYIQQQQLVLPGFETSFWVLGLLALVAGTIFLMWLGEQIDEYGLGNGISLLILAGIVSQMPQAVLSLIQNFSIEIGAANKITIGDLLVLALCFVGVTMGAIAITQAQRRIPIQQAKHTRGRKVYGGTKQYLPLRVNHGGVMPIIFAQSLMLFPGVIFGWLDGTVNPPGPASGIFGTSVRFLNDEFDPNAAGFLYVMTMIAMIFFFSYFWTTVQFQPKEMANQLRDYGSFIPGLRPGKRTAEYLERVMNRITYVGGAFLAGIAIVPTVLTSMLGIDYTVTAFLGGTGLLIVVSVALDMVQRIEANLLMRNYKGFLADDPKVRNKRVRGRQF